MQFSTPITAIVGPNGSGKSNIAEAVRFVLGEQSIKSLRGKRGEDLIFNGTHTLKGQSKAAVAIVFDNTKRVLNVDYDEVSIERTVFRDSQSEYRVNGSAVRLKDILEMLSALHIGASNHHIISQGEADRILLASTALRREMIEDALGLKIYHYKKNESVRKLVKVSENLGQVRALKKEIEPHLKFLEKQVVKIEQGEQMRGKLRELSLEYATVEASYLENQKKTLAKEYDAPTQELRVIEKKIQHLEQIRKGVVAQEGTKSILELEQKISSIQEKKDTLSRSLGRAEGLIEYEERKLLETREKATQEKQAVIPFESIDALHVSLSRMLQTAEGETELVAVRVVLKDIKHAIETFFNTYISKAKEQREIADFEDSLKKRRLERENIRSQLAAIGDEHAQLRMVYFELQKKTEEAHTRQREGEREFFLLQNRKIEIVSMLELLKVRDEQLNTVQSQFDFFMAEIKPFVGSLSYSVLTPSADIENRAKQEERRRLIERTKIKLEEIGIGGGDTLKEYKEVKERNEFLGREIEDLEKSAESLTTLIDELTLKIDEQFKEGIHKINVRFQELFAVMFGGGKASLHVLAPPQKKKMAQEEAEGMEEFSTEETMGFEKIEEEGIEIDISLPRKKIKGLAMLSGGERALVSIALIFAMTQVNPPPFLILDETDAALDEVNSRNYGKMLLTLSKETELILITHNRETMAHAGVLYGVTAVDGVSRVLSVKFEEAQEIVENTR